MANNFQVKDAAATNTTIKTTDTGSVHVPHHNIDVIASGASVDIGIISETAYTGSGSKGLNGILKGIYNVMASVLTAIGSLPQNNILAAGTNIVGKVGVDQTTPGVTNGVVIKDQTGAFVDWNLPATVSGMTAADAALTVAPLTAGGLAKITNPVAVQDGDVVNTLHDKLGKQVVVGAIRALKNRTRITIANTTETDLIAAGATGVFRDIYMLMISNTSAVDTSVTLRDGATVVAIYRVPAGATVGFSLDAGSAINQATAATKWSLQSSTSVTSIEAVVAYVENL